MKPAERRIRRQQIDLAKASVQRWSEALSKFLPGTVAYIAAKHRINEAQKTLDNLQGK